MKQKAIGFLAVWFSFLFLFSFTYPAAAASAGGGFVLSDAAVRTMAVNAACSEMGWTKAAAENIKPVEDFTGAVIGYSVDLTNLSTWQNGYLLLSSSPSDEPVMEFSKEASSPYDSVAGPNDTCIFCGIGGYYAKSAASGGYYCIGSGQSMSRDVAAVFQRADGKKDYRSPALSSAQALRKQLISAKPDDLMGQAAAGQINQNVLNNLSLYDTSNGCSATSAAMAVLYDFPKAFSGPVQTLTNSFAAYMHTDVQAQTAAGNIPTGLHTALYVKGLNTHCYNTAYGRTGSTWYDVYSQIDGNRPLLITDDETGPDHVYASHTMCVIGWQSGASDYMTVYDSTVGHDSVSVNYNSAAELGSHFCFTIIDW